MHTNVICMYTYNNLGRSAQGILDYLIVQCRSVVPHKAELWIVEACHLVAHLTHHGQFIYWDCTCGFAQPLVKRSCPRKCISPSKGTKSKLGPEKILPGKGFSWEIGRGSRWSPTSSCDSRGRSPRGSRGCRSHAWSRDGGQPLSSLRLYCISYVVAFKTTNTHNWHKMYV